MEQHHARPQEHIEGAGLVLRRWVPDDVERLARAVERNIEHLRPWMPWVADEPLGWAARRRLVERWEDSWATGGDTVYGAFRDGVVVGSCGLHRRHGPGTLEIGYWVDRDHVGHGTGTSIARMLTSAALAVPGVGRVEIHHDEANLASGAIPRRLGYRHVATARATPTAPGEVGIDWTWRMEAADWRPPAG